MFHTVCRNDISSKMPLNNKAHLFFVDNENVKNQNVKNQNVDNENVKNI